jgi:hypothetical protein
LWEVLCGGGGGGGVLLKLCGLRFGSVVVVFSRVWCLSRAVC